MWYHLVFFFFFLILHPPLSWCNSFIGKSIVFWKKVHERSTFWRPCTSENFFILPLHLIGGLSIEFQARNFPRNFKGFAPLSSSFLSRCWEVQSRSDSRFFNCNLFSSLERALLLIKDFLYKWFPRGVEKIGKWVVNTVCLWVNFKPSLGVFFK